MILYELFASMQNIENLWLDRNNLTEFSPELLRSNNKLEELRLYSNELSDLEAEQLLEFLPNLKIFYWDDNEVSCTRVVEINRMLISKGIEFNESVNAKVRFYPQNRIFGYLTCNPDISWMASNYRKENSKISQRMKKIDGRMLKVDDINEKLSKVDQRMNRMDESLSKVNQQLNTMEQKLSKIDQMEGIMHNLLTLMQDLKYQN